MSDAFKAEISIRRLGNNDAREADWASFIDRHPDATFFHRWEWKEVIETSFSHECYYLYAEADGKIVGVLPLVHVKSFLFGNNLSSLPFCVYGGVLSNHDDIRTSLVDEAISLAKKLSVGSLELRSVRRSNADWKTKSLYVTFRKEIADNDEANLASVPRKQRAMIRKGIKAGLTSVITDSVDEFHHVYAQSVHALGTPVFSKKYFQNLKRVFGDDCEIMLIKKDDRVVSGVLSFYFKDQVLPYYGGGGDSARDYKANDFMYWELMCEAVRKGVTIFDFGRSKAGTGAYSFKKNWGFEPEDLQYEYYLVNDKDIPDINPLNPKYRLFINMWRKMPLGITKMIGPHIVKNLG